MMKLRRINGLLLLVCCLIITGCSNSTPPASNEQLDDMELVVSAQQGRIQILEKKLSDLELKLEESSQKIETLALTSGSPAVDLSIMDDVKDQNYKLVRLLFQSLTSDLDKQAIKGLIETYETVYEMLPSPDGTLDVLWVTDGSKSGEVYTLDEVSGHLKKLGLFEDVSLVKWSPNSSFIIVETKFEDKHKGYLINVETAEALASMEYTGIPLWSDKNSYFVYLNANPNIVYTGTETQQMHTTGVFLYTVSTGQFSLLDPGGIDYLCKDLSIDSNNEIKYVRQFTDGKQTFSSVKFD